MPGDNAFRVYPQKPWRFDVLLFPTQSAMYRHALTTWDHAARDWAAICLTRDMLKTRTRSLGEILFCRKLLSAEIVAHEATHAAMTFWALRTGMPVIVVATEGAGHASEEAVASIQASLLQQMMVQLQKRKAL
jgi:hypothetical protein